MDITRRELEIFQEPWLTRGSESCGWMFSVASFVQPLFIGRGLLEMT